MTTITQTIETEIGIRKMSDDEFKKYSRISYESFVSEIAKISGESLEEVKSRIGNPPTNPLVRDHWYIVELGKMSIGYFWIRFSSDLVTAFGYDIHIDESFRGKGIGRRVMEEGRKLLFHHKIKKLQICVFNENVSARKLYESMGFIETGYNSSKRQHQLEIQL